VDQAKKMWKGDNDATCYVLSLGQGNKKETKKARRKKGFAAKIAEEFEEDGFSSGPSSLPKGTEVAIFVTPGPKELTVIETICGKVGMGTLVILLNARLSKIENFGTEARRKLFIEEFEPVFQLTAAPQDIAPNCLVHRAYPREWMIGRKPKVGQPKVLLSLPTRPSSADFEKAYNSTEISNIDKGIAGVLDDVAGWFQ